MTIDRRGYGRGTLLCVVTMLTVGCGGVTVNRAEPDRTGGRVQAEETIPGDSSSDSETSLRTESSVAPEEDSSESASVADGARYLAIVNDVNCAFQAVLDFEEANSLGNGTIDPAMVLVAADLWGAVARARQIAYRRLLDEQWPDAVKAEVELLARDWARQAQAEQGISTSSDVGMYNITAQAMLDSASSATGNAGYIRALLDLGPAEETDRC